MTEELKEDGPMADELKKAIGGRVKFQREGIAKTREKGFSCEKLAETIAVEKGVTVTSSPQEPPRSLQATQEPSTALQAIQSSLQARLDAVERRIEARAKQAEWLAWINGMTFGLALATVLFVLLWLLVNGGV